MGFLNDIVNGKEKKIKADPLAKDINAAGKSGIGMMNSAAGGLNKFYENPDNFVNNQIDVENNAIRSASQDALRRTKSLIAQRGMGMSSLGLGQEVNAERDLTEKLAMNKASGMDRLKGLYNEQMNTGNQLYGAKAAQGPVQMTDTTYRTGGYGQLIGAGIGATGNIVSAYLLSKDKDKDMNK